MGLFKKITDNLVSKSDRMKQSHLRNFYLIAIMGSKKGELVSDEDYQFIENLGLEAGLSKSLIYEVFNTPSKLKSYPSERVREHMYDYIEFALRYEEMFIEKREALRNILIAVTVVTEQDSNKILDELIRIVKDESDWLPGKHDKINATIYGSIFGILPEEINDAKI